MKCYICMIKSIEIIDDGAFLGCKGLRKINLPESLKKIGCEVFSKYAVYWALNEEVYCSKEIKKMVEEWRRQNEKK